MAAVDFYSMNEAEMRQWVEANPGRVNLWDRYGCTPMYAAVWRLQSLPLTVWLLDEKGADVNATTSLGTTPLCVALFLDILTALMTVAPTPPR